MKLCEVSGQLLIGGVSEQQLAIDYYLNDGRVIVLSLWLGQFFIPPCVSLLPEAPGEAARRAEMYVKVF